MNQVPQSMNSTSVPVCALCRTSMQPLMQMPVRVGGGQGFFMGFKELDERILMLDTYRCPTCRRLDFFDLDLSLPIR